MNLDSPAMLYSGLIIGMLGLGMFIYGKKAERPAPLAIGLGVSALPLIVHSVAVLWAVTGVSIAAAWTISKLT